jgi:hypothetical protein
MGFFDRLFGREPAPERAAPEPRWTDQQPRSEDQQAIERYRYLLRTAPPEAIEQVHAEAFAKLTPEQRQQVLGELTAQVPAYERGGASADPRNLARLATRAEARQPGTLERTFGNMGGGGPGFGSMLASSMLGSIAGYVIGSAIADQFFSDHDMVAADGAHDSGGFDQGGDIGGGDADGGDFGGGDFDFSDV